MANFQTHLSLSTLMGIGYGGVAYGLYEVPLSTCVLAGSLCSMSGMLPDVDSNASRPLRESTAFAAAVVPMMLVDRLQRLDLSCEWIVLAGAAIYLFVRFVLGEGLRRFTVHRGMFHSLPAAVIVGEVAFLLASGDDVSLRAYKAGGVVLGYLSHLLLDELYSVEWYRGRLRAKKSLGSALKLVGHKLGPNLLTLAQLAALTYIVVNEPEWTLHQHDDHDGPVPPQVVSRTIDRVVR